MPDDDNTEETRSIITDRGNPEAPAGAGSAMTLGQTAARSSATAGTTETSAGQGQIARVGIIEIETGISPGQPQPAAPAPPATANNASGVVQAFRDIRRELTPEELSSPGVQKLILDRLDSALAQCEKLSSYESRFHEKDKRVDVLEEQLKPQKALDIAFAVGLAVGPALVTLAPVTWDAHPTWIGKVFLIAGLILTVSAIAIKWRPYR
jgi:hypothetical protein